MRVHDQSLFSTQRHDIVMTANFIWSFGSITRTKGMVYTIIQFVSENLSRKAKCAASTFDDSVRQVISKRRTRY